MHEKRATMHRSDRIGCVWLCVCACGSIRRGKRRYRSLSEIEIRGIAVDGAGELRIIIDSMQFRWWVHTKPTTMPWQNAFQTRLKRTGAILCIRIKEHLSYAKRFFPLGCFFLPSISIVCVSPSILYINSTQYGQTHLCAMNGAHNSNIICIYGRKMPAVDWLAAPIPCCNSCILR